MYLIKKGVYLCTPFCQKWRAILHTFKVCNFAFKLLDITDIIFSPVTSCNQAAGLAVLIEEHHSGFKRLCPNCSIIKFASC